MITITNVHARQILDSRGKPTVEVDVFVRGHRYTASVPSGASTGRHEAVELQDGGTHWNGRGVGNAVRNVNRIIAPLLKGKDVTEQRRIDELMVRKDGTENKRRLGANAILGVSLACARAGAGVHGVELYQYLTTLTAINTAIKTPFSIPRAFFNVINGGKHADNALSFQEFMIVPKFRTFRDNLRAGSEIYHLLKKDLHKRYGKGATNVGDEGGFAPEQLHKATQALDILQKAIDDAGYTGKVGLAIDCAASEFYRNGSYHIDGKMMGTGKLLGYYLRLIREYNLISLEDPFHQEDFQSFAALRKKSRIQIVGDDLTVTNVKRIQRAISEKSCTCLLLKVNQIGTLTEALDAAHLAYQNRWNVMVSHRSGETEDTFIADLAVALGCGMIKAGAPCRGERTAKYNRLLRIEENLST